MRRVTKARVIYFSKRETGVSVPIPPRTGIGSYLPHLSPFCISLEGNLAALHCPFV